MLLQDLSFFCFQSTGIPSIDFYHSTMLLLYFIYMSTNCFQLLTKNFRKSLFVTITISVSWDGFITLDILTAALQVYKTSIKNISSFLTPTIHLLWPDIKIVNFFSKYIMSNFSYLCWWQLLQVCVQPEGRVYERCVCPVPGNDGRQILNHCHNLSPRHEHAIIESMFSQFFSPTSVQVAH